MTVLGTPPASSPDERSDIRDRSNTAPDIAALIRATLPTTNDVGAFHDYGEP